MSTGRPVYLNLFKFRWPFTAIASITHRVTGVALFFALAFLLYWLDRALASPAGFAAVAGSGAVRFLAWLILVALAYHLIAGVKHLLLDFHVADGLEAGHRASQIAVGLSGVAAVLLGAWLW